MAVTHDPVWDDDSREAAYALWEQDLCPECGMPIEVCSDPERSWHIGRRVCERRAALTWAQNKRDKVTKDTPSINGFGPTDGEALFASEFDQGDEWFLRHAWPPNTTDGGDLS